MQHIKVDLHISVLVTRSLARTYFTNVKLIHKSVTGVWEEVIPIIHKTTNKHSKIKLAKLCGRSSRQIFSVCFYNELVCVKDI